MREVEHATQVLGPVGLSQKTSAGLNVFYEGQDVNSERVPAFRSYNAECEGVNVIFSLSADMLKRMTP